jgi:mono/diheme cytochrome c family protein
MPVTNSLPSARITRRREVQGTSGVMNMDLGRVVLLLSTCGVLILPPVALTSQQSVPEATSSAADKESVKRGEAVFSRHCPICHLGRPSKTNPFIGRNLRGILKNVKPERETAVRDYIRKGGDTMPGYQYTLAPDQIDDLMGYLKTYN